MKEEKDNYYLPPQEMERIIEILKSVDCYTPSSEDDKKLNNEANEVNVKQGG